MTKSFSVIFFVLLLIYILGFFSHAIEYPWEDMDWNNDGTTSFKELFDAADIGKEEVQVGEDKCTRYYAYKDGNTVKMICPNHEELSMTRQIKPKDRT